MRVGTYNFGDGPDREKARDLDRLDAADLAVLGTTESTDRADVLAAHRDHHALQANNAAMAHTALLLAAGVKILDHGWQHLNDRTKVGRLVAGARRTGYTQAKWLQWVRCEIDGETWTVGVAHFVPSAGNPVNRAARRLFRLQAQRSAAWFAAQDGNVALVGDFNARPSSRLLSALRAVADPHSKPSHGRRPIDIIWTRKGADVTGLAALAGYSSDHRPVVADVAATAHKPAPKPKEAPVSTTGRFIPTPPFVAARWHGGKQTPKAIVMHATVSPCEVGGARNIAHFFAHETNKTSAHYVVDPGEVIQCVGDHTVAYHCGYNTGSIAVELCDPQSGSGKRWGNKAHVAMLANAETLVARLCLAYGIEARHVTVQPLKAHGPHGIYSHNQSRLAFGHTTHTDPGGAFPWSEFMRGVRAEMDRLRGEATPAKADAPEPVKRPYHEAQAISEARTVRRNAAKHGHKGRARKWADIIARMLGRK